MMRLSNVSHAYDEEPVLEDVSVSVSPGEVVGIIGPSGVGKTTLLRILALFMQPQEGAVELDGQAAWGTDDRTRLQLRRKVGMVFQEASLFDGTVAQNVEYGLRVRRSWPARLQAAILDVLGLREAPPAIEEALDIVELTDKRDQAASSLSGGEAQRVSFARALAYDPTYLLLDEPTSDLDPRNTGLIEDAIRRARDRGLGVVIATHDMHQAQRVADRVGVLLGNGITEIGPTDQIFEDPADERTRQFIAGDLVY
ncbi:amino acid ABC transporter ATP-binding protein [Halodesulfurarchaeum formicicum]|uniref:Tungstate transport system ATP-binding protein n=1 Tax=Halodesulfurarchaeum formicicum TaxID=1873524 RepID=A0A1J1AE47_9EURY|nr:phosphate ABC transporter ATP-binding protein [Halodesulfurarchaeum formicicum]APE96426.1 tungstate transport system ATP-binding protein [Halodesulfurarchaeum formicicum]